MDKRIIALIEVLGLTPGEFADKINVQRSGISHITSGRNKPSLDFLESTLTVFPEINADWLILGKGKPLKSQNEEKNEIPSLSTKVDHPEKTSPLLFPMEEESSEIVKEEINTDKEQLSENCVKNSSKDFIGFMENTGIKKRSKKGIKKILILYDDNSFEVYED